MSLLRSLHSAFSLMTGLPLAGDSAPTLSADTPAFFPWVGWALGGITVVAIEGLRAASEAWGSGAILAAAPYLIAAILVAAGSFATRFLHWDGLADTADAMWNPGDTDRKLEIMADSSTGAFGATAIVLAALLQVAALGTVLAGPSVLIWGLLVTPILSRSAATFAAWLGEPARSGGLAHAVMGRPSAAAALAWFVSITAAAAVMWLSTGAWGLVWSLAVLALAAIIPHLLAGRIGGVTGDVMGASVVVAQTLGLVLLGIGSAL